MKVVEWTESFVFAMFFFVIVSVVLLVTSAKQIVDYVLFLGG